MKLILSLLILCSPSAFAANELFCRDVSSGPDHGYQALFSTGLHRVSISEQTIAGPRRLALLNCSHTRSRISCSEPVLRDAGYSFAVQANNRGVLRGALFAVTFVGSRRLANMICQRRH